MEKPMWKIESDKLTPAMKQYVEVKRKYPDCLILFRMGDFYEIFYEDAVKASEILEITLTSRGKGEKKAPLAGIPYHALDPYLAKLVKKGHKAVIVEQIEDPKLAKGLVKRDVVRVVTPGTVVEDSILDSNNNNFLVSLYLYNDKYSMCLCDISTGEFYAIPNKNIKDLQTDIVKYNPAECIVPYSLGVNYEILNMFEKLGVYVTQLNDSYFSYSNSELLLKKHFDVVSLDAFGINDKILISSAGALLKYLADTQFNSLKYINKIKLLNESKNMVLDASTLRNLEILKNIKNDSKKGTLLSVLDKTSTAMGGRLLKKWIKEPLLDKNEIEKRLNTVECFIDDSIYREELMIFLKGILDLERLTTKVNHGSANARDLLAIKNTLKQVPFIKQVLNKFSSGNDFIEHLKSMDCCEELLNILELAILEEPSAVVREGNMIKPEFDPELKQLHDIKNNSKKIILEIEEREKNRTGIRNLRIKYNRVFGYYIEVSKSYLNLVPENYIRKQTTVNAERFINEELKEIEEKIINSQEKIVEIEYNIFQNIVKKVVGETKKLQDLSDKIAMMDVLLSFAKISLENNYVRPEIKEQGVILLEKSRHPVIELIEHDFVPNDICLDDKQIMLITGPNMAGKSTVMRQVALNVMMAQIGCFCAAQKASLPMVDKIFTRVGAYDDLVMGQSTFMVEMIETGNILNNSTEKSLIILDEIGRGTSTFDGVALAWSIAEYIYNNIKAKTMFATHYHVLNKLAEEYDNVNNYNILIKENNDEIIFLRKLVEGSADKSYGVQVAKLAGLPLNVIERAKEIQNDLEKSDEMSKKVNAKRIFSQTTLGVWKNDKHIRE